MGDEVSTSHDDQVRTRREAIDTSVSRRREWSVEQSRAVRRADEDGRRHAGTGARDVETRRREGARTAQRHLADGDRDVRTERQRAERDARRERDRGRRESRGGFLSWLGSKVAAFLDGIRSAIRAVFDAARRAVRGLIARARDLATRAIRAARDLVVRAIQVAGAALVLVGDVVLAAFPAVRNRFRALIRRGVEAAVRVVNAAAAALERGVQALLDGLARALDCALQYLEAGYLAAVDVAASAVKAALDAAQRFLDTLAEWAEIIKDVAADPSGWLRALARSAVDGVRNCLVGAMSRAIREWFNSKVEAVVGVGRMLLDVLVRGCISLAQVGTMVWEGIKAALPGILIQLLVEKLVSLLVPAGAALMLIIDGLRAAWGAASRILAAFQKFMAFLKAVRTGSGPGAFAELVAAASIAVLDFLSNFLVSRLRGAAQGVGSTLRAMAQRLGGVARRAGGALVRGARVAAGAVRRGAVAVGRGAVRVARRAGGAGAARCVAGRAGAGPTGRWSGRPSGPGGRPLAGWPLRHLPAPTGPGLDGPPARPLPELAGAPTSAPGGRRPDPAGPRRPADPATARGDAATRCRRLRPPGAPARLEGHERPQRAIGANAGRRPLPRCRPGQPMGRRRRRGHSSRPHPDQAHRGHDGPCARASGSSGGRTPYSPARESSRGGRAPTAYRRAPGGHGAARDGRCDAAHRGDRPARARRAIHRAAGIGPDPGVGVATRQPGRPT